MLCLSVTKVYFNLDIFYSPYFRVFIFVQHSYRRPSLSLRDCNFRFAFIFRANTCNSCPIYFCAFQSFATKIKLLFMGDFPSFFLDCIYTVSQHAPLKKNVGRANFFTLYPCRRVCREKIFKT